MTEATIRGLIQGGAFAVLAILATLVWKLLRSKSEGARRLKWVLGAALGLFVLAMIASAGANDRVFMIGVLAIIGAAIWIYKGSKRS